MKVVLALLVITAASAFSLPTVQDVETEWSKFKIAYGKVYKSEIEESKRKGVFAANYELIKKHNEKYALGLESYTLKINKFADSTTEERKFLKGYKKINSKSNALKEFHSNPLAAVPDTVDWRAKGAVTRVKNQGACGSCWAFSTTGSLEGQYFLKTGKLVELSEQNLVDCSTETYGCNGGDMTIAFEYIHKNDGIDSEDAYPYKGKDAQCIYDVASNVTSISGYVLLEGGNENKLKQAVATVGPISVAIDASSVEFDFYESGIYAPKYCMTDFEDLNHAVLAVGYGTENGKDYWLVKNSYDTDWGLDGYIKMIRNDKNHCGIASDACYPLMY